MDNGFSLVEASHGPKLVREAPRKLTAGLLQDGHSETANAAACRRLQVYHCPLSFTAAHALS